MKKFNFMKIIFHFFYLISINEINRVFMHGNFSKWIIEKIMKIYISFLYTLSNFKTKLKIENKICKKE